MSGSESSKSVATPPRTNPRSELKPLLELRRQIKERTPKFRRFESWRYVRIHEPWRKPKGIDNHMRLSVKGWPALVKVGYRTPKKVRYLHPSGYRDVLVHNMAELEQLSPETDAARLAASVGRRKKIELAMRAKVLGIRVLNGRNLLIGVKAEPTAKEEAQAAKEGKEKKEKPPKGKKQVKPKAAKKARKTTKGKQQTKKEKQ